jgi:hypothetical protein
MVVDDDAAALSGHEALHYVEQMGRQLARLSFEAGAVQANILFMLAANEAARAAQASGGNAADDSAA